MNWLHTFHPSALVGSFINELKAELREYDNGDHEYDRKEEYLYDLGWYSNTTATIERLESLQDELRRMEG